MNLNQNHRTQKIGPFEVPEKQRCVNIYSKCFDVVADADFQVGLWRMHMGETN